MSVSVTNGALIAADTFGQGNAGKILVNAANSTTLSGVGSNNISSGLITGTEIGAKGNGGDIIVNTPVFRIADGAFVNAQTFNSSLGGNVTINSNTFEATNGGQVITSTRNSGRAGNISLNVTDKVTLFGSDPTYADRLAQFGNNNVLNEGSASGLFANASEGATGQGGDLKIETGQLNVQEGAEITAKATGEGSAGNVTVNADTIQLDRGSITAFTANGTGGNVFLDAKDLILMSNNSLISAEASRNANGGNVGIDTQFLVAFPNQNNDIVAFAERGNGGKITINNQRIFGLQERKATPPNNTNDIDASSEFGNNGTVTLVAPEVDPTSGILELPSTPVDAESLISKDVCRLEDGKIARGSSFVITGKGGLPPSAEDPLINPYRIIGWETDSEEPESNAVILRERPQTNERGEEIYPVIQQAQGWKISPDGTLLLTAQATTATPQSPQETSPHCRSR